MQVLRESKKKKQLAAAHHQKNGGTYGNKKSENYITLFIPILKFHYPS